MTPLRLGSRYQLEERLGEGGLGVVWRGSDITTGAGFAIKLLRPEHARDPAAVARFMRERTALLRFRHPNVVALHDMIVEGDRLALVMELVADGDLAAHRKRCGGTLDASEATQLMAQVCAALATAHAAGILHRDVKPANILLDKGRARLTDFGIAQIAGEPSLTSEGVYLGTLPYLAPEVIQGDEPTPACDTYAAGITLYELLAGELPFPGQAAAIMYGHLYLAPERPADIPDSSWRLISACLDKDPRRRPTATELELALRTDPWLEPDTGSQPVLGGSQVTEHAGFPRASTEDRAAVSAADPVTVESRSPRARRPGGRLAGRGGGRLAGRGGGRLAGRGGGRLAGRGGGRLAGRALARGRWIFGALALVAAAGVTALALGWPSGPSHPAVGPAVTVTEQVTPAGQAATLGQIPGSGPGGPSPQPGATGPPASASASPGSSGTAHPSPGSTGVTASATAPSATRSASPTTAPSSPAATATPSATPTPSQTRPADTSWQCGALAAATLSSGKASGQTLQACIRVNDGKLDLTGMLNGTKNGWKEQIILVLQGSAQDNGRSYTSPVCTTSDCTFTASLVPASGEWTVLPQWVRKGSTQSAGNEPAGVYF